MVETMNTSKLDILKQPDVIILATGHGGNDSGAIFGTNREADQTIFITDEIKQLLENRDLKVIVAPHSQDTDLTISWINRQYSTGKAWAIEIHRDSADDLSLDDASRRCGVYYKPTRKSQEVGSFIREAFVRYGAHKKSWARPDTDSNYKWLGWIRQTNPVAHLLELGFMQGKNDDSHLLWLANVAGAAIYESFTGNNFSQSSNNDSSGQGDLLEQLAKKYKRTDLGKIFSSLNVDVNPEEFDDLKEVTLAQWILESGWATSPLAQQHNNFAGLKWRDEMRGYATPVTYRAHDGEDEYCKFENIDKFIEGYWRFLMRSPYRGWNDHTSEAREFIQFLLNCGYTTNDTYENTVVDKLVPRAIELLSAA